MKTFELSPINGAKSFYGKCRVIEENGVSQLLSYDTVVAEYNYRTNLMKVFNAQSNTTIKHINAFMHFHGFNTCTKKELLKSYNVKQ